MNKRIRIFALLALSAVSGVCAAEPEKVYNDRELAEWFATDVMPKMLRKPQGYSTIAHANRFKMFFPKNSKAYHRFHNDMEKLSVDRMAALSYQPATRYGQWGKPGQSFNITKLTPTGTGFSADIDVLLKNQKPQEGVTPQAVIIKTKVDWHRAGEFYAIQDIRFNRLGFQPKVVVPHERWFHDMWFKPSNGANIKGHRILGN